MALDGSVVSFDGSTDGPGEVRIHQDTFWTAMVNSGFVLATDDPDKVAERITAMSEPQARKLVSLVLEYNLADELTLAYMMSIHRAQLWPWLRDQTDDPKCLRGTKRLVQFSLGKTKREMFEIQGTTVCDFKTMMEKVNGVTGVVFFIDMDNVNVPLDMLANVMDGRAFPHPVVFGMLGPGKTNKTVHRYSRRAWCCIGNAAAAGRDTADMCLSLLAHEASKTADKIVLCTKDHFGAVLSGNLRALGVAARSYTDHELIHYWNTEFGPEMGLINVPDTYTPTPVPTRELKLVDQDIDEPVIGLPSPDARSSVSVDSWSGAPKTIVPLTLTQATVDEANRSLTTLGPQIPPWFRILVESGAITLNKPVFRDAPKPSYTVPVPPFPVGWIGREVTHKGSEQPGIVIAGELGNESNPTPKVLVKSGAKMPRWWYVHDVLLNTGEGIVDGGRVSATLRQSGQVC